MVMVCFLYTLQQWSAARVLQKLAWNATNVIADSEQNVVNEVQMFFERQDFILCPLCSLYVTSTECSVINPLS